MRALLQRVNRAAVSIMRPAEAEGVSGQGEGERVGEIGRGLVVLVGITHDDVDEDAQYLVEKIVNLRIFPDGEGRFNLSAMDIAADLLLVSQFTLYADTRKGRRPSFTAAAPPEKARALFERFVDRVRATGLNTQAGRFQEHMLVDIHNDGPVTIMLDSADRHLSRSGTPKEA